MWDRRPKTMRELRAKLVGDSIERERWMKRFVVLVREDERSKVLGITDKARERAADR